MVATDSHCHPSIYRICNSNLPFTLPIGLYRYRLGTFFWGRQCCDFEFKNFTFVTDTGCLPGCLWLFGRCCCGHNWQHKSLAKNALDCHCIWIGCGTSRVRKCNVGGISTCPFFCLVHPLPCL